MEKEKGAKEEVLHASDMDPPDDNSLKKNMETAKSDAVLNSRKEKKKRKSQERRKNAKIKKQNESHNALENNDVNRDCQFQDLTLLKVNSPCKRDSCLQAAVNNCLEMDSAMVDSTAEVNLSQKINKGKEHENGCVANMDMSFSQEKDKGTEHNQSHDSLDNNSIDHGLLDGGHVPCPELMNIKHSKIRDLRSASSRTEMDSTRIRKNSEVLIPEKLSGFSESSGTCSMEKRNGNAEADMSVENFKTYRRKPRVRIYRRRGRKHDDSSGNSLEPIKDDGTGSSIVHNCMGESTVVEGLEDNSMEETSANCSDDKPAFRLSKKRKKVNNLKVTGNEDGFVEDVSMPNIPEEYFEEATVGKVDKIQIGVQAGIHVEENLNDSTRCCKDKVRDDPSGSGPSCKDLDQKNMEIEMRMEEIFPSSSHLGVIKDDVNLLVSTENKHPAVSHSSPERAHICCPRKKLLILDVNGLLADIVPYITDGYKPDTTIAKKGVFKRPFCEDFLQFCFERFAVGVWSSRTKRNVDNVLDFLMGDSKNNLLFCWDQGHCTSTGFNTLENRNKPLVLKELKKLWEKHETDLPWEKGEYNESNTLLLDDSPYKALRNPVNTAIFPRTYRYKDVNDSSLGPGGDLRLYLEGLAEAENVQRYVKQNPFGQRAITESNLSWKFYRRVIDADSNEPNEEVANSSIS